MQEGPRTRESVHPLQVVWPLTWRELFACLTLFDVRTTNKDRPGGRNRVRVSQSGSVAAHLASDGGRNNGHVSRFSLAKRSIRCYELGLGLRRANETATYGDYMY